MVAAAALLPMGAGATDLKLSLGAAGEYDSNIFHRESDIKGDYVVMAFPQVDFLDTEGKFTYDVSYLFPYQHSIDTDALRNFSHIANVSADYHMSDQTQFSFSNYFSYLNAVNNSFDNTPNLQESGNNRVLRNDANFGVTYLVSPRLSSQTTIDQEVFSTNQNG